MPNQDMRICFFGDSFTNGTGDDTALGWVGRLCAALTHNKADNKARNNGHDITAYNLGIRRDTTGDIAARWFAEASARLPEECSPHFVFAMGNNDTAPADADPGTPRLPLDTSMENVGNILASAKAWGPTLLIGPVPIKTSPEGQARTKALSDAMTDLCETLSVPFLNLHSAPEPLWQRWHTEAAKGDGAHPNAGGYADLAAHIGEWPPWRSLLE
jgi:acyl-CoA thioesterase I